MSLTSISMNKQMIAEVVVLKVVALLFLEHHSDWNLEFVDCATGSSPNDKILLTICLKNIEEHLLHRLAILVLK